MDPPNTKLKNEWGCNSTLPNAFMARTGTTLSAYFTVPRIKLRGYSGNYSHYIAKMYPFIITN